MNGVNSEATPSSPNTRVSPLSRISQISYRQAYRAAMRLVFAPGSIATAVISNPDSAHCSRPRRPATPALDPRRRRSAPRRSRPASARRVQSRAPSRSPFRSHATSSWPPCGRTGFKPTFLASAGEERAPRIEVDRFPPCGCFRQRGSVAVIGGGTPPGEAFRSTAASIRGRSSGHSGAMIE